MGEGRVRRDRRRQECQSKHPSLESRYKLGFRLEHTKINHRTPDSWADLHKIRNGNS